MEPVTIHFSDLALPSIVEKNIQAVPSEKFNLKIRLVYNRHRKHAFWRRSKLVQFRIESCVSLSEKVNNTRQVSKSSLIRTKPKACVNTNIPAKLKYRYTDSNISKVVSY